MLEFFRNYQRYFFFLIAVVIITSFAFFGTYSALGDEPFAREDRIVAFAVEGSPIMESKVRALSRFLSADQSDLGLGQVPNLCNDGVIRNDFLKTGLGDLVAQSYIGAMKKGLEEKLAAIKRYRLYAHPDLPELSVRNIWSRLAPSLLRSYDAAIQLSEPTPQAFHQISELYLEHCACPSEFVRRLLAYQMQQNSHIPPDPRLRYDDLSLFGFHTSSDWLGSEFFELCAEFILNAAKLAEKKGFQVTGEEAKAALIHNFNRSMQRLAENKKAPDITLRGHLHSLGFDEKSAIEAWRSVLLFRKYFDSAGAAALVDRLGSSDFASFAKEAALVELYEMPSDLRMRSLSDMAELQIYLDAVATAQEGLSLRFDYAPLEAIEQKAPDLIGSTYRVELSRIEKEQVGLKASLKQIIDWLLDEPNWNALRKDFAQLPALATQQERLSFLEECGAVFRAAIDAKVRKHLVDAHPEWLEEAFTSASKESKEIEILPAWTSLDGLKQGKALQAKLDGHSFALSPYTENETTLYRFFDVQKIEAKHLLSFREAKRRGILAQMLDRRLNGEYPKIRERHPDVFKNKEGNYKPLSQTKEAAIYYSFLPLIQKIGQEGRSFETYPRERLAAYAKEAHLNLQIDPLDPHYVKTAESNSIEDQFKLEKKTHEIQRTAQEEWMKEQVFVMAPKQWSPVHVSTDGEISFFYFESLKQAKGPILEQIEAAKQTLSDDAKRYLAQRLLEETLEKHSITLISQGGEP